MKKITALLLMGLILLAACGGEPPPEIPPAAEYEPEEKEIIVTTTTTTTSTPVTTTRPPRTEPPEPEIEEEPEPLTEPEEIALLIERFNSADFNLMPAFNDINEIPLEYFIRLYFWSVRYYSDYDFEYTKEQLEELNSDFEFVWFWSARGVYPQSIENYVRENYSINFSIEHYDFNVINDWSSSRYPGLWLSIVNSAVWDEEKQAVIYLYNVSAGGGNGTDCKTLKVYQEDDIFYVISADLATREYTPFVEGYFLHIVERNENGGFNILSKQPVDINEISFTEEEKDKIKASTWYTIMVEDRFALTYNEITEIAKNALASDNITISEFNQFSSWSNWSLSYSRDDAKNYYIVGTGSIVGEIIINKATGEVIHIEYIE